MAALDPAVAAVRSAVRRHLLDLNRETAPASHAGRGGATDGPGLALVACSGGPDSLALAAVAAFVAPRAGWRAGLVTVDHRLQPGSAERAEAVAAWGRAKGLDPVEVAPVRVAGRRGGVEAAAREARYEALTQVAREYGARAVLLGHTQEDQAETVLLALLRGAGPRGIAAMPAMRSMAGVVVGRPLLESSRAQTRAVCAALGLTAWDDPHNADPAYARTRARALLGSLAEALGPAVVANLARTARQVAADTAVLDAWAAEILAARVGAGPDRSALDCDALATLPDAVRTRVLHAWALTLGCPGTDLSHRHVAALDALVTHWRGQGEVYLPASVAVRRAAGQLVAESAARRQPLPNHR